MAEGQDQGKDAFNRSKLMHHSSDELSFMPPPCANCDQPDDATMIDCEGCGAAVHRRCAVTTRSKQHYFCRECYERGREAKELATKEAAKKAADAKERAEREAAKKAMEIKESAIKEAARKAAETKELAAKEAAKKAAESKKAAEAIELAAKAAAKKAAELKEAEKKAVEAEKAAEAKEVARRAAEAEAQRLEQSHVGSFGKTTANEYHEGQQDSAEPLKGKARSHQPSSVQSSRRLAAIQAKIAESEEEEARVKKEHLAAQLKMIKEMQQLEMIELEKRKQKLELQAAASSRASSRSSEANSSRVRSWVTEHSPKQLQANASTRVQFSNQVAAITEPRPSTSNERFKRHSTPGPEYDQNSRPWFSASSSPEFTESIMETTNQLNHNPRRRFPRANELRELPTFTGNSAEWPMFLSSFMRSTQYYGYSNEENLLRLQKSIKGNALTVVGDYLCDPESVPDTLNLLRMKFGRPEIIIDNLREKLDSVQPMKSEIDMDKLIDLAMLVNKIFVSIKSAELSEHHRNPMLVKNIVGKLSPTLKLQWAETWLTNRSASIADISKWLLHKADAAGLVVATKPVTTPNTAKASTSKKGSERVHMNATAPQNDADKPTVCPVCEERHELSKCENFSKLSRDDRWKVVIQQKVCANCLQPHNYKHCKRASKCSVAGCTRRHHTLLHRYPNEQPSAPVLAVNYESPTTYFRILPISLHREGRVHHTFAFIDEGSSISMIDDEIADILGLPGDTEELCLRWTGDTTKVEKDSRRVDVDVELTEGRMVALKGLRTVKSLNLPSQTIDYPALSSTFPHLRRLPIKSYHHAQPKLLIGLAHWGVCVPTKIVEGKIGDPIASKCRLGWTISGKMSSHNEKVATILQACDCNQIDNLLSRGMREFFSIDNFGTGPRYGKSSVVTRAEMMLQKYTEDVGGQFQVPLLWKHDEVSLPESFKMAEKRLSCLVTKMTKNPELGDNLRKQIKDYEEKGYIGKLTSRESQQHDHKTWYLPLFAVTNPNKPGKVRMVWDAAAQANGTSLNDHILVGPDLLTPLTEVLYRFRQYPTAVSADIQEMYHQVLVKPEDRSAQRFLWKDYASSSLVVYQMRVMTFGAACSPSAAQFVKNLAANNNAAQFPEAAREINRNFYVDDYLSSHKTPQESLKIAEQIRDILSLAHFNLRHWASNSDRLLQEMGEANKQVKDLNVGGEDEVTKVLGLYWNTRKDELAFAANTDKFDQELITGRRRPTKREVLRMLMMIFDPLGLIAHILVQIKMLIQELWRVELGWDDQICDEHVPKWSRFVEAIPKIAEIKLPRCYLPSANIDEQQTELHILVDASEAAFAAVAYLRIIRPNQVTVALVGAKTKVAPQKPMSVPRLELQAAVLGTRLAAAIESAHDVKFATKTFWSDSSTVLAWLRTDPRKHQQFVALRLGELLESTSPSEWRYVPTADNVADDATKWSNIEVNNDHRWFNGPPFLYKNPSEWPTNRFVVDKEAEPILTHLENPHHSATPDPERFSKWTRLLRAQAVTLKVLLKKGADRMKRVNREDIARAEQELWRYAQNEIHGTELAEYKKTKAFPKHSALLKLSPFTDKHGVLRIRGRTTRAIDIVSWETINPVILPKGSRVTALIVEDYHRRFLHANNETVVNEIRQRFWVPGLRSMLRRIISQCMTCRIKKAKPTVPMMADIPTCRLQAFKKPFSSTGLDYFGPIEVAIGRRREKRWVALFTCLTIRAIHLEIAEDLTSDSTIIALRSCMARRGDIDEIWCDNGTNFCGASKILKEAITKLNKDTLQDYDTRIKWNFIPPVSPHMGGAWERLVRSVKSILTELVPERCPKEGTLRMALLEAERIINTRPLTYVPLDSVSAEALTPNHFLLGQKGSSKSPGDFTRDDLVLRKQWRIGQYLADQFWRRWVREYLPTLTRRTKWHQQIEPIKVGDVGIIWDENCRGSWQKGRVVDVLPSKIDGQVRVIVIKTESGTYTRPASKFAKLDVLPEREADGEASHNSSLHGGEDVAAQI